MAEGIDLKKNLSELEKEITCAICQEHYTEPKLLPCGHYYCKKCILGLALKAGAGKPFPCPECREKVVLPKGGEEKLKTAFFINRIKESISLLDGAHGEVTLSEAYAESGAKDSLTKKCPAHKEPLIVYCFDCDKLICSHCTVKVHKYHKLEFNEVAAPGIRKKLMEKVKPLRELEVNLSHAMVEVQTTRCELEAQELSVTKTIQTHFSELQKIVEDRRKELLEQVTRKVQEKMGKLTLQEKNLSFACTEIRSFLDNIEQSMGHSSDNEFMGLHAQLACQIQQQDKEHNKQVVSLEPVEEVDIGVEVRCAEALQQLCQTKAKLTQLFLVISDRAETVYLNEISECTLTTIKRNSKVDCCLRSLSSGSTIKCNIHQTGARNFSIQYTPTVRGRCELTVSVDGQQVADSPFPIFVSVPVAQIGMPVSVWRGLSQPTGVAVNSMGEVVVVGGGEGDVIIFDKQGKRLGSVQHKLQCSRGVAVDGIDNIYCIDFHSNKIMRCNRKGGRVKVHKVKQVQGPGHWGVAVVGDEVMVCERGNGGTIMVYDRELKYARKISGNGMGEFYDLSPDSHGNLYVTDRVNSFIRVFNSDGRLLRSFGCAINGVKKLSGPCGVCVAGQYVYVTDVCYDNVFMFTTEGAYVTSFGHRGSEEGSFIYPCGVYVDKDGFVYVTDHSNDRVQIF